MYSAHIFPRKQSILLGAKSAARTTIDPSRDRMSLLAEAFACKKHRNFSMCVCVLFSRMPDNAVAVFRDSRYVMCIRVRERDWTHAGNESETFQVFGCVCVSIIVFGMLVLFAL